ncbi:MAG: TMEM175 family protein [Rhodanobacteraceae bacterium]
MPEPPTPAETDAVREPAEGARLDNFVDGAFAFAITLLVISGAGLPKDVAALEHALRGIPAFAACFGQLAFFWFGHVRWRDTVRLIDTTSMWLSLLLVFFALIFVFPLHLVFAGLFSSVTGSTLSPDFTSATGNAIGDTAALFVCYGLSFACMAGTLAALYWHGLRARTRNGLTEAIGPRLRVVLWGYVAAVGLLSTLMALVLPAHMGAVDGLPGFAYFLLAFLGPILHFYRKRLTTRLPS